MKTLLAVVLALSALAAAVPVAAAENVRLAQASAAPAQKYQVVIQVSDPDPRLWAQAINRGVKISACQVTMRRQKLTKDDMLPDIGYVPGGLVRILELQRKGWSYIKG